MYPFTPTTNWDFATWGDSLTAQMVPTLRTRTMCEVFDGGVGGETSTQIRTRCEAAPTGMHSSNAVLIWAGRNNFDQGTTVKADIAAMVALLHTSNYLVLSVLNGDYGFEVAGGTYYTMITTLNTELAAIYGSRYFDMRAYLIAHHDQSAQDLIDTANDIPPTSLRQDQLHLNAAGYRLAADKVLTLLGMA